MIEATGELIIKIIKFILSLFRKKTLSIPHPEEKPDYNQTLENTDVLDTLFWWFVEYQVPVEYRDFWLTKISITVTLEIPPGYSKIVPAWTWEQDSIRYMKVRPEYLNAGVVAHEQAHNSYALLDNVGKTAFSTTYNLIKDTDPLIKLLYSKNTYGLTSDIEGHAEVYRYLCEQMPEQLKQFYPKLF